MKSIYILFLIASFVSDGDASDLVIRVGDTIETKTAPYAKIIVTNGKNVHVTATGASLRVRGKSTGTSRISAGEYIYDVSVLTKEEYRDYKRLKNLISEFQGLELEVKRPTLTISGELLRASDWSEIIDLDIQKMDLKFQAKIHPQVKSEVRALLVAFIENHHTPIGDINLDGVPTISYHSTHQIQTMASEKILKPTGIQIISNPSSISTAPMVRTNIMVASLRRDKIQKIGIKWPDSYSAQIIPDFTPGSSSEQSSVSLRMLESKGWGKILASPTLLCRSGMEASFFAGGEIPIRVIGYRRKNVTWKSYGVSLKIKPLADYQGQMSINIQTEVSNLDDSKKVEDIPAIISNKTSSHFDLTKSRTIALSGLISEESGTSQEGVPGLLNLPVLGSFFASEDYRNHKSELVIFVTPEIVLPNSEDTKQMPQGWHDDEQSY
ncbi:MAG: hypothetical protein A4S09_12735 [Proteobacteria bacterium SG_bin7]|nr:MAG: hypothetical protein A4S09_12735 [Proteobacteria bacterium SG_bin7]